MWEKFIDQTNLKPNTTKNDIDQLIYETWTNHFYGICISTCWVKYVAEQLKWIQTYGIEKFSNRPAWNFQKNQWMQPIQLNQQNKIQIIAVVGFPLGNNSMQSKIFDAKNALLDGANEIDMVVNLGMFLSHEYEYVITEINEIKKLCVNNILKVILETGYLNQVQLIELIEIINQTNVDFIKTSTGFGPRGASYDDVKIMKQYLDSKKQIKAAGGIKDSKTVAKYIKLGATRIGTSNGVKILKKD